MDDDAARVRKLLRQQAAIAGFGSFALREPDLLKVLTEAARVCANGLEVPFSKVCRYREAENDLLIEAGVGWHEGVIGHVVSRADASSPQGRAFITGEPSVCDDLGKDDRFVLPPFYAEHRIVSTIDVVIKGGDERPYGVLEIDSDEQYDYDQHDVNFLTAFANVLAEAVATSARTGLLETTIAQMRALVEDKDELLDRMKILADDQERLVGQMKVLVDGQKRLLDQKKVLAEELQHRVRNNLQLVYGMLSKQLDDTTDEAGRRGIKAIARRVSTLAQVYDHLLGTEMTRTTDFGGYVRSLCLNLAEIQATSRTAVKMTCDSETLVLDLDVVTALGIVVAELVTNSYDHAFPSGKGAIVVSARRTDGDADTATMIIRDNGTGFTPSTGNKRHGLGLVRRLVEQIRGTVMVASDQGTVWTISFPLAFAPDPAMAAA